MPTFFARLREERNRLGLNQTRFAALGGVTKETQLHYENGSRKPDSDYLTALVTHDVDVMYVLTGTRALSAAVMISPDEASLIDKYRRANEQGKATAKQVIDVLLQSHLRDNASG